MDFSLPRELYEELVKSIGKDSAEKFSNAVEKIFDIIYERSQKDIIEKKEYLRAELYNELRNELATKEFVRAEINELRAEMNELRAEIRQNGLLLKILIGISIFALTIFNPNFVSLVEKVLK